MKGLCSFGVVWGLWVSTGADFTNLCESWKYQRGQLGKEAPLAGNELVEECTSTFPKAEWIYRGDLIQTLHDLPMTNLRNTIPLLHFFLHGEGRPDEQLFLGHLKALFIHVFQSFSPIHIGASCVVCGKWYSHALNLIQGSSEFWPNRS